ncbi:MAG: hypothetical protein JWO53_536 [Chlamydiia bacterium]|nr:hypothetical protein [Chlamydiia bacterium]
MSFKNFFIIIALFLTGCHPCCVKDSYHSQYHHLSAKRETLAQEKPFKEGNYYLALLVDAKHLDYTNAETLLSTVAKHPNGSRERDVGHAWIILGGIKDGKKIVIEGGHSGELGIVQPRYLEGIFLHMDEPNPIRYLFSSLKDGYFENGPGKHAPTYALYIDLPEEKFLKLYDLIQPEHYHFSEYSLTESQCTIFVAKVAALAGIDLDHEIAISVPEYTTLAGEPIRLWKDPQYSTMTISTPDILERSMIRAVQRGEARPAVRWYGKWRKNFLG